MKFGQRPMPFADGDYEGTRWKILLADETDGSNLAEFKMKAISDET
jgi:hypothetical protein